MLRHDTEERRTAEVHALRTDPLHADLPSADLALLRYALVLNDCPGQIEVGHVQALREAGFGDRAIHDVCAITAYFAFVNRIADGLGVELEPEE